jgi:eukaryotic-like serine/threonine-protein kinase
MSLVAGTKLGPYEIQSPLGAGGMGEVYRAKDTRLDRTVAVKILPSHLSDNVEAKQRFDREARAISSLNHPNICTLHDVGHQDGVDFLVMEFLEGETLADRLRKGPLPTELVLKYGIEICEGLERAHKNGVVHRDLKPGNVMLTKTGAKLMDFGLAKATPGATPASSLTMTMSHPSADQPLTAQGTIVGTFQYMSPEQTEGKEADARSDIFALGAVLYEMATGKRAFTGKSQASVVAAILASDPPPISAVQPMSPPALEQVVKSCLSKDPEERFQTVHDLKLQLKWIVEASASQLAAPAQVRARRVVQKRTLVIAAGVGWLLALAALGFFLLNRAQLEEARRPMTASWLPPPDTEFTASSAGAPALSPDGSKLAFLTGLSPETKLWVRDVNTGALQPIEVERPTFPFWSPDGKYIGFFSAAKLKKVALAGGPVQVLCDAPEGRGASWSPRGVIIFTPNIREPLYKVAEGGGVPERITEAAAGWTHRNPYFLPDGDHFLFINREAMGGITTNGAGALYGASLSEEKPRKILEAASNVQYSDGYLLYLRETVLVARRFDPKSLKFGGDPMPVAEKLDYWNARDLAGFTAAHGTLVYRHGSLQKTQPMWVDRTGKEVGRFGEPGLYLTPRPSPDGTLVGLVRPDPDTGKGDVWIADTGRNTMSRSTFADAASLSYAFSPDAKQIAVGTIAGTASSGVWIQSANGSGSQEKLDTPKTFGSIVSWSPNGRYIFFMVQNNATRADVYYIDLNGDKKLTPFIQTPANETGAVLSPNGKWLAYYSDESGRFEVYVTAFPGPGGKWQVSNGGGNNPAWSADGKQLYYTNGDKLMLVPIQNMDTFQFGAPTALPIHLNEFASFGPVAPGERFPALKALSGGQAHPQEVILNWTGILKQ